MPEPFWRRKFVRPFIDLLRQGTAPEQIALTIALGISLGVTPVLGSTSILCAWAAIALRLNLPAIQVVNYLVYPLQILLLLPFLRLGAWVFGVPPIRASVKEIFRMIRTDVFHTIAVFWVATMHALVVWLVLASAATVLLYVALAPVFRLAARKLQQPANKLPG